MNLLQVFYAGMVLIIAMGGATVCAQSPLDGFDPNADGTVRAVFVQPDGKILIGGDFTTLAPNGGGAFPRNFIARLNQDGTPDTAFNPNANSSVSSIAVQPDGKILIGGFFSSIAPNGGATVTRNNIARLNADGTLDPTFNPKANGPARAIVVQADGKILIGGDFTTLAPNGGGDGDAQPNRPAEYGRHARYAFQSECQRQYLFNHGAVGREDFTRRQFDDARAKRRGDGDAQPNRPA